MIYFLVYVQPKIILLNAYIFKKHNIPTSGDLDICARKKRRIKTGLTGFVFHIRILTLQFEQKNMEKIRLGSENRFCCNLSSHLFDKTPNKESTTVIERRMAI